MQLAFNKMGKPGKGTITGMREGGRRMRNSILTGYLWGVSLEMLTRHLDIQVWRLGKSFRLKIKFFSLKYVVIPARGQIG